MSQFSQITLETEITNLTLETKASKDVFPLFVILSLFLVFFFGLIMRKLSLSFPSFGDFAKISPPFLQRVMCSSTELLEEPKGHPKAWWSFTS